LHFPAFIAWEARFAKEPILPLDIWTAPCFLPMVMATFLTFAAVGIDLWYIEIWNIKIRGFSLLLCAAAFTPLAVCGSLAAVGSGKMIRYVSAEYILGLGSLASAVALILVATQGEKQVYWAQTFPSLFIVALGPDFIFTAAQIIASNAVKRKHQGIAGSLVGTLASYGLSTGLGFAATVETYANNAGRDPVRGYRNALYLGVALAGLAMCLGLGFVRIPKDERDGWDEDDEPVTQEVKAEDAYPVPESGC
jgi:hypothetical protein